MVEAWVTPRQRRLWGRSPEDHRRGPLCGRFGWSTSPGGTRDRWEGRRRVPGDGRGPVDETAAVSRVFGERVFSDQKFFRAKKRGLQSKSPSYTLKRHISNVGKYDNSRVHGFSNRLRTVGRSTSTVDGASFAVGAVRSSPQQNNGKTTCNTQIPTRTLNRNT